ncbi:MAG: hypothetical protein IJW46_03565, partial [Clostridia bacterium]|nr:hypothetical protein [Clostridia bacterium]
ATGTNEKTNAQNNERFTKRTVGCILLGIGLVSMILGILFSETTGAVLFILSLYLLAGSTLCFLRTPYQGYLALALFWVITIFVLFVMMAHNPFTVFIRPLVLNISTIVDVLFWSGLIISILVASFRLLRKRKRK